MAALNHVCVWSASGWKKVTVEEILEQNPYGGISARSGLLMCELCGQYVTLTRGPKISPYFKHSKSEDDKSCKERTFGTGGRYRSYDTQIHDLPIRLKNTINSISLEIGLLSLPAEEKIGILEIIYIFNRQGSLLYSFHLKDYKMTKLHILMLENQQQNTESERNMEKAKSVKYGRSLSRGLILRVRCLTRKQAKNFLMMRMLL